MDVTLTPDQRAALETAVSTEGRTRCWKRYQAVLLVAEGLDPQLIAHTLRCHVASVYGWVAAWRREGMAGLAEGPHPGAVRRLVIPDREAAVEVRQADRQMEEPGAWRLAVLEADRLARQRPDGSEAPDRQTDVATAHAATVTHGIGAKSRVDPDCSSGSGRRTGHRDSCDRRARPG